MEKLPFNKAALLENLKIQENSYGGLNIKLINKNVRILLSTGFGDIMLDGFYKGEGIEKKGITRCALYVLLLALLEGGVIQEHDTMKVSSPSPNDGNMERLIKIYTQIGFTKGEPQVGNPVNLYSTIQNLIKTLKEQCEITGGGKRRKRKTRKRRKKKTKKRRKCRRKKRKTRRRRRR